MTQRIENLAGDFRNFPDIQQKLLQLAVEAKEAGVPEKLEEKTKPSKQTALVP